MTWIMPVRRRFISTTGFYQLWLAVVEALQLTLVCPPFSPFHIFRLCSQGQEIPFDRAFGILFIEESFGFAITVAAAVRAQG